MKVSLHTTNLIHTTSRSWTLLKISIYFCQVSLGCKGSNTEYLMLHSIV